MSGILSLRSPYINIAAILVMKVIIKIVEFSDTTESCLTTCILKGLAPAGSILVSLFVRLMTPNGAIWSRDQKTVKMR